MQMSWKGFKKNPHFLISKEVSIPTAEFMSKSKY